eukprot:6257524-Ditylum_brightwellii.AAC.1
MNNEDVELNHFVLECNKMLSNIMSKHKKQCYSKSMHNINNGNDKKQWGNNDGNCSTYVMSAIGVRALSQA